MTERDPLKTSRAGVIQLKRMTIDNFKSLVGFSMSLTKFTCLIGLNGAGKSTILQAMDFLSQQMRGDLTGWLKSREWKATDLKSKFSKTSNISFELRCTLDNSALVWRGSFNRSLLRCTQESIEIDDTVVMKVDDGRFSVDENGRGAWMTNNNIAFEYQGSLLSQLKEDSVSPQLRLFKGFIATITSLDALSPQHLRRKSRETDGGLGFAGEKFSSFLHALPEASKLRLLKLLSGPYPHIQAIDSSALRAGWKSLSIQERYADHRFSTEARHMNDGMLRLMAILAETLSDHQFMLFDEVENGINPEVIEFLLDHLVNTPQQVMVTTHSPMVLNYLEDEVAREGVQLIYKTQDGRTRAIAFFGIPAMSEKLRVMGPGEVFVDTNLVALTKKLAQGEH